MNTELKNPLSDTAALLFNSGAIQSHSGNALKIRLDSHVSKLKELHAELVGSFIHAHEIDALLVEASRNAGININFQVFAAEQYITAITNQVAALHKSPISMPNPDPDRAEKLNVRLAELQEVMDEVARLHDESMAVINTFLSWVPQYEGGSFKQD
jgi:acetyl-CoA acetyltransferase